MRLDIIVQHSMEMRVAEEFGHLAFYGGDSGVSEPAADLDRHERVSGLRGKLGNAGRPVLGLCGFDAA